MRVAGISHPLKNSALPCAEGLLPPGFFGGRRCRRRMRGVNARQAMSLAKGSSTGLGFSRRASLDVPENTPSSGFATFSPTKSVGEKALDRKRSVHNSSESVRNAGCGHFSPFEEFSAPLRRGPSPPGLLRGEKVPKADEGGERATSDVSRERLIDRTGFLPSCKPRRARKHPLIRLRHLLPHKKRGGEGARSKTQRPQFQ